MFKIGTKDRFGLRMRVAQRMGFVAIVALLIQMAGCRTEHDDHEEESHFPPHWPKSFLVAADRLEQITTNPTGTPSLAENIEQELVDLIDWLPELLADSDISKEDFDKIDEWAFPLSIEFKKSVQAGKKIDELLKNEKLRNGLSSLAELARQTRKRDEEDKAREEQETAEAKPLAEQDAQATIPNPGSN